MVWGEAKRHATVWMSFLLSSWGFGGSRMGVDGGDGLGRWDGKEAGSVL